MTEIRGILLAAGAGRRFGGHKLLHPLPSGELVGVAAAHNLVTALPNTLAIVRKCFTMAWKFLVYTACLANSCKQRAKKEFIINLLYIKY
ncbi:MAG: hypothetical protein AB2825_20115 [Candidatus Thiodiazotropha endolucinida]